MTDLAHAAKRKNVRRYTKNAQRMRKAFGAASGPEGHALVQRYVGRLTEWIKANRALAPKIRQRRSLTIELQRGTATALDPEGRRPGSYTGSGDRRFTVARAARSARA